MSKYPTIENAPGLTWKPRKTGWECRWHARTDLIRRGFTPKSARLWSGAESDLTSVAIAFIQDRANALQDEMLVWGRGGIPVVGDFDGSLKSLIGCYQTDADSTYRKLRYRTRGYYDTLCRRLNQDHGSEQISDIKARHLLRWHEDWSAAGKIAMAHALVGMLRTLVGFGATILESEECERLSGTLSKMRFSMAKPRLERLTADQANAIRAKAHDLGKHSIALAQAFQFELMLRQKDVIGEWVPGSEPGLSDVTNGNSKWLRGIRWSEIDGNLILRHTTSKRQKDIEVDLRNAPMVMEELDRLGSIPSSGPVVVSEIGIPYTDNQFRHEWRKLADLCGIPKTVRNMDSRAGAISEATDAGADIESVRQAATHSNSSTTMRYSRNPVEKTAAVQIKRVAHRNKGGN